MYGGANRNLGFGIHALGARVGEILVGDGESLSQESPSPDYRGVSFVTTSIDGISLDKGLI